jgi:hypothetical protein
MRSRRSFAERNWFRDITRSAALLAVSLGALGCAEDLALDTEPTPTEPVVTEPAGDAFTTRVDASDAEAWIYFSFVSGGQVIPADPLNSLDWDLAFQRFHILSNGGASGVGGRAVALVAGQPFEGVTAAPTEGYVSDLPDGDDDDTIVDTPFEAGDGWYDYDDTTNRLSPRANVYVVQTGPEVHYKLSILDYYDAAGSSGHPSFSWAALP